MKNKINSKTIAVIAAIFAAYCVGFNVFKVASTTSLIMQNFGVNSQQVGSLVSASGVVGLIFCLPAGAFVTKFGPRIVGIFSIACSFLGSLIGSFAPSFEILLFSRMLEGVSVGCISTIVPPLITDNIDYKKRSIYMGIFTCFAGVAQIIIFSVTNALVDTSNPASYTNLWHFSSIFIGISLVFWIIFVKSSNNVDKNANTNKVKMSDGFANPMVWICCIVTFFTIAGFNGGTNYTMSYCESMNLDPLIANDLATIRSITMIVGSILAGIVISPFNTKKRGIILIILSFVILIALAVMWRYTSKTQAIISMLLIGLAASAHPSVLISMSPELSKDPKLTGITNAFIGVGQNLGTISVGAVSGRILESAGFGMLSAVYIGFGVIIILTTFIVYFWIRKNVK